VKLSALTQKRLSQSIKGQGLAFRIGPFNIRLSSPIAHVSEHIGCLYGGFDTVSDEEFIDFNVTVQAPFSIRRYFRPQVNFSFDGFSPFKPLPYTQAAAFFEWGLNWCVANHSHQFLIIHAAVVELNGQAFIFPGTPGSGKSTLCAALVCRGWRLLSDEMALLSLSDHLVYPIPRPVSLKNESLDVIQRFSESAIIGPIVQDTTKGTIGHMRPPDDSVNLSTLPAQPYKVIFPKYKQGAHTELTPLSKGRTLLKLAENSFNYSALGVTGFTSLVKLCDTSDCFEFSYSNLDEAIALFTDLAVCKP
jgi:HprK-related kinase A